MKAEPVKLTSLLEHLKKDERAQARSDYNAGRGEKLIMAQRIAMEFGMPAAERALALIEQTQSLEADSKQAEHGLEPNYLAAG